MKKVTAKMPSRRKLRRTEDIPLSKSVGQDINPFKN